MTPYYDHAGVTIYNGDCTAVLQELPESSVHCCITSPPYYGLRDYGNAGQIGLERTYPEYVDRLVSVFREVRRVLRDDGTLWLNLGDSYANDAKWGGSSGGKHATALHGDTGIGRGRKETGLKPKNLIGIPWRVAFALQADGWYLRSDIIWAKPNPTPESVMDRPTKAHEYLFLLAKSETYYYDAGAISEKCDPKNSRDTTASRRCPPPGMATDSGFIGGRHFERRNKRSVWTVPVRPFDEAHFATFPEDLIRPCILAGCPAGGTVLDPFLGAGTTALVSKSNGRLFVGAELNQDYCDIAANRVKQDMIPLSD